MTTTSPTFTLITTPRGVTGSVSLARKIAAERNFRAPHHTASREGMAGEMAIAAGGVLYLDEPAQFSRSAVHMIANLWRMMDPACRPQIVVAIVDQKEDDHTAMDIARVVDLFDGWTVAEHHTPKANRR